MAPAFRSPRVPSHGESPYRKGARMPPCIGIARRARMETLRPGPVSPIRSIFESSKKSTRTRGRPNRFRPDRSGPPARPVRSLRFPAAVPPPLQLHFRPRFRSTFYPFPSLSRHCTQKALLPRLSSPFSSVRFVDLVLFSFLKIPSASERKQNLLPSPPTSAPECSAPAKLALSYVSLSFSLAGGECALVRETRSRILDLHGLGR